MTPGPKTPPAREAASQRIANDLRAEILSGVRRPGERIRQEIIAEEFGASRLPVREALRILESDGLVTLIANTGAWVSTMDLAECTETYLIRERLDPLLLMLAVPNYSDADVDRLESMAAEVATTGSVEGFLELDRRFHLESYRAAGADSLYAMVERLWNTTQHYRRAYTHLIGWDGLRINHLEHTLMLDSFRKRDAEEAERLMHSHLRRTRLELARHPEIFEATIGAAEEHPATPQGPARG
ncbi:GntR family transcriptional regulator [Leucobacter sp. M11]|uniref:GntR family transcriptional regulator n=1 Tax=Leucobacter sp. M11 TaxID=2993565 RepID=UPI002D7EA9C2|nr:GntR family transcriptional regulator [Leucobacter sp. M11]MEB4613906.1 GntR family transcriptional regulator [Leucobacter sp. M11]